MTERIEARRAPDGYVAQRFPQDFNGHGRWLLAYWQEDVGLAVRVVPDDEVAGWPELREVDV